MSKILDNERRIVELLAEQSGMSETEIVPAALLIEDLWMDSLDLIEVVMGLEDIFNIEIPDVDCDGINTVQGLFDLVNRMVQNK